MNIVLKDTSRGNGSVSARLYINGVYAADVHRHDDACSCVIDCHEENGPALVREAERYCRSQSARKANPIADQEHTNGVLKAFIDKLLDSFPMQKKEATQPPKHATGRGNSQPDITKP